MKKITLMTYMVIFFFFAIISGCEKEEKKDYSLLFKNTVWTGEFKYTGGLAEPVSIEFKEDGKMIWHELQGVFNGTWNIENNKVVVNFSGINAFKAGISDDNKFVDIENNPANVWGMVHAGLNEVVEESLNETTWSGTNMKLNFKAGDKVDMELGPTGSTKYNDISYTHKGKSIYFAVVDGSYRWFIVRDSKLTFTGINVFKPDPTVYQFQISKD